MRAPSVDDGVLEIANGAIVAIDPFTGHVLALSGGFSYGSSQFDRAMQAMRQPGSTFKPFVYATALDQGYTPITKVLDAPFAAAQGPGLPLWTAPPSPYRAVRSIRAVGLASLVRSSLLSGYRPLQIADFFASP